MPPATPESEVLRAIHARLGSRPDVRLWRVNVAVAVPISQACPRCRPKAIRFGLPGMADLLGIVAPSGRMLSVEIKSEEGRMSKEQVAWSEMVTKFGGVSLAPVRSVDMAEAMLEEAMHAH